MFFAFATDVRIVPATILRSPYGSYFSISSLALRPRARAGPAGCHPALRQNHSCHAGTATTRPVLTTWCGSFSGNACPETETTENVYTRAAASFQNWRQTGVLTSRSRAFDLPLFPDVHGSRRRSETSAGRAAGLHRPRPDRGIFRRRRVPARADAGQAQGRPVGPAARQSSPLRSDLHALQRRGQGGCPARFGGSPDTDPDIEVTDEYDVVHRVWKISDPAVIASVQEQMRDRKLIIADGHHRYETALTYRNERRADAETSSGLPAPYDSVMMTFVDMDRSAAW